MPEVKLEPIQRYEVRLFVGGCVERGDESSFRRRAHAHVEGQHKGWICIRSWRRVLGTTGRPSRLVWHEVAHCLVGPRNWHNATWNRKRLALIRENASNGSFSYEQLEKIPCQRRIEARSQPRAVSIINQKERDNERDVHRSAV